jgi:hypothetical protein
MNTIAELESDLLQKLNTLEVEIRTTENKLLSLKEIYLKTSGGLDALTFVKGLPAFKDEAATRI